jgi:DnaJ family protein A protein 5
MPHYNMWKYIYLGRDKCKEFVFDLFLSSTLGNLKTQNMNPNSPNNQTMASAKRCHYEVLGLSRDCTPDEIRSCYRKLALQRHPDKLVKSGLSQSEATAQFQELQHAYEVLSDPKERAWYDSHRSQILFSDPNSHSNSVVPDLFSFFSNTVFSGYSDSGKGFYKVYSDVFDKVQANEINFARKIRYRN